MSFTLKAARVQNNLKQEDVSDRTGIPIKRLRGIENGLKSPTYEEANKLASLYGIPTDHLIFLGNSTEKPN